MTVHDLFVLYACLDKKERNRLQQAGKKKKIGYNMQVKDVGYNMQEKDVGYNMQVKEID